MNGKNLLFVLTFMVLLAACKTKPEDVKPPKNILSKDRMVVLLADIHLAEAKGYMERINNLEKQELLSTEYSVVLKKHNLSMEELDESYEWYLEHPLVFETMYDRVIEQIKLQEQYAVEPEEKKQEEAQETNEIPAGKTIDAKKPLLPPEKVTN